MMKQSPIFVKSYDLLLWLIPRTLAFPKSQRGVLARQVQGQLFVQPGRVLKEPRRNEGMPLFVVGVAQLHQQRDLARMPEPGRLQEEDGVIVLLTGDERLGEGEVLLGIGGLPLEIAGPLAHGLLVEPEVNE